jgi:hypothetical protein
MKIQRQKTNRGGVLVVTVIICALIGPMLAAYLSMVSGQHHFTQRSQVWNNCIPMCEAGVEEAMAHINYSGTTSNFAINGWVKDSTIYRKTRPLNGGEALMQIDSSYPPIITVRGRLRAPYGNSMIARTVRVQTRINLRFPNGILARGVLDLGGAARVDSFNSTNSLESGPGGIYDLAKATDRTSVVTVSRMTNALNVGNADIYGKIGTGPGGTVTVGATGSVGDTAYNNDTANNGTIQTNHVTDDINVYIPEAILPKPYGPAVPPLTSWPVAPDPVPYDYVLESGDYYLNSLNLNSTKRMIITGKVRLWVPGPVSVSSAAQIIIAKGGSIEWYAGGDVYIGGIGLVNTPGLAKNFTLFGLNGCTSVTYAGSSAFTGTIYAPNADVKMIGNGEASGAFVGKTFKITGSMNLHYDEALQGDPREGRFLAASWREISL